MSGDVHPLILIKALFLCLGIGGVIGVGGGWLLSLFLKHAVFLDQELKNLVVLAGVLSSFSLAQVLRSESGLMAAVLAGIVRLLQQRGESVVLIDTNPDDCAQARQENLQALVSNGLDLEVLESAGLSSVGTFLAISSNPEVNSLLAQLALSKFHPHTLAILPQNSPALKDSQQIGGEGICQAFASQVSVEVWTQYIRMSK